MATTSKPISHWSLLFLRLGLGWYFMYAGWTKVITFFTPAKDWTAAGFLGAAQGPFATFFKPMIGSVLIDYLNAYGLLLIGIALLVGIFVRWASFWGAVLMILYWAAAYPAEHALFVDDHIIYALAFIVLGTLSAGHYLGIDDYLEKTNVYKKHKFLNMIMG